MQDKLIFLIAPPRSGSTLLARMLGAHSAIHAPAEPHLLTPMAHLGFYRRVDAADYDPIISETGIREVVAALPGGEADYLDALRAYSDRLYEKLLAPSDASRLLDKTPAYALVLDFLARLYPEARYVVLTRHPMAVWASYVESFFDGDHDVAHAHNPLLERYVPAMARFVRESTVPLHHVHYEALVQDPAAHMEQICHFLGLPFEPGMVDYGSQGTGNQEATRGLGDPMTVAKQSRPTTESLARWAGDWAGKEEKVVQGRRILEHLVDADLATWGFDRREIEAELAAIPEGGGKGRTRGLSRYSIERRLVVLLRRNIHQNALGKLVRKVRWACDVLLR
jgi:hypothetical protein